MAQKIHLAGPHMCGREMEYIKDALRSNWIAPVGPHIEGFEREVSKYVGARAGLALSSGTAAIHLALITLGVGEGDTVFCSSFTFAASANPIIYQGAKPVFIDSEPESFNMSPLALEKAFKKHKPKAVIVVHLYGQSCDMDPIMELCKEYGVPVVEDAAESLGATYKGRKTGTIGKLGIFSFNGNKIITTSGGGILVSDDVEAIERDRFWSAQAKDPALHYQHSELGYNYRMSNICAAIGRGQLTALEERISQKRNIYRSYEEAFSDIAEIEMMPIRDYGRSNYWLSVITLDSHSKVKPYDIIGDLADDNIESRPVWKPMHLQPFYKDFPFYSHREDGISVSEDLFNRGVCLPSDTKMATHDIKRVIRRIRKLFLRSVFTG